MKDDQILTAFRLREIVNYDPLTGLFSWKQCLGRRIKSGTRLGTLRPDGCVGMKVEGKMRYAHRLAWLYMFGEHPTGILDHINGDPSDNRISNIRAASVSLNMQNKRKAQSNNKTGLLGAYAVGDRFRSVIRRNGKQRSLGFFDTAEAAHQAYVQAKRKIHKGCTI